MKKSIFEQCGGTYTQVGDYLLPNLIIDEAEQQHVGKYGRMRKRYLKEHRPVLITNLLLSQGHRSDGMGQTDEQHPESRRRDRAERACLLLRGC